MLNDLIGELIHDWILGAAHAAQYEYGKGQREHGQDPASDLLILARAMRCGVAALDYAKASRRSKVVAHSTSG